MVHKTNTHLAQRNLHSSWELCEYVLLLFLHLTIWPSQLEEFFPQVCSITIKCKKKKSLSVGMGVEEIPISSSTSSKFIRKLTVYPRVKTSWNPYLKRPRKRPWTSECGRYSDSSWFYYKSLKIVLIMLLCYVIKFFHDSGQGTLCVIMIQKSW